MHLARRPGRSVNRMVASHDQPARRGRTSSQRLVAETARPMAVIVASRGLMSARRASTTIRIAPCAPICQSGEMRMKDEERAGQGQRHGADHRADRRHAPADELAAAQDHAGDRQQRVRGRRCCASGEVVRPISAEPRQHAEEAGQREHQHADLEQRPAGAVDGAWHCRRRRAAPRRRRMLIRPDMRDERDHDRGDDRERHDRRLQRHQLRRAIPAPCRPGSAGSDGDAQPDERHAERHHDLRQRCAAGSARRAPHRPAMQPASISRQSSGSSSSQVAGDAGDEADKGADRRSRSLTVRMNICAMVASAIGTAYCSIRLRPTIAHARGVEDEDRDQHRRQRAAAGSDGAAASDRGRTRTARAQGWQAASVMPALLGTRPAAPSPRSARARAMSATIWPSRNT